MTVQQITIIKESWKLVSAIDPVTVGDIFYSRLFEITPEVKPLFRSSLPEQSKKLMATLGYIINRLDKLDTLVEDITNLARNHVQYGVKPSYYTPVGEALLYTLEKGLGAHWNNELKEAWGKCYGILSSAMINVSDEAKNAA